MNVHRATKPLALLLVVALSATSCTRSESQTRQPDEDLQIVTTFLPITNFTLAVVGDRAQVTQLLPPNVSPHDYQAKPQDVQRIAEADLLIENGLAVEEFLSDLIDSANNPDLILVDSSKNIAATPLREGGQASPDRDHSSFEKNHTGSESHRHENSDLHTHGEFDPHIWLDPKKAQRQVANIRDALIAADPEGTDIYTDNAKAYIQQLQALDQKISQSLAPYAEQTLVSYHDFADHFSQSYGIYVEHIVDVPEATPTPADMQRVIETAERSELKTLLSESAEQNQRLTALAKDMNIQISQFDPMENSGPEGQSPHYYLMTMTQNLENLEAAFAKSVP